MSEKTIQPTERYNHCPELWLFYAHLDYGILRHNRMYCDKRNPAFERFPKISEKSVILKSIHVSSVYMIDDFAKYGNGSAVYWSYRDLMLVCSSWKSIDINDL